MIRLLWVQSHLSGNDYVILAAIAGFFGDAGLDAELEQALEHPTKEIDPEVLKAIGPADLPTKPLDKD